MITTKTANYFESKVRVERITEDGMQVKMNELYVVDAVSFTECEAKVNGFIGQSSQGEFEVMTEARARYREIFFSDEADEDTFYKVRVAFIVIDDVSGKEKRQRVDILVQAKSVETAKANVDEALGKSMQDYKIQSVVETSIVEVIE